MRSFTLTFGSRQYLGRLARGLALIAAIALVSPGTIAQADSDAEKSEVARAAKSASTIAVSEASGSPGSATGSLGSRRGISTSPHSYVGMTRTSERRQIDSIDPASWLARFGEVEAVAVR
jgi:hypothetical protein